MRGLVLFAYLLAGISFAEEMHDPIDDGLYHFALRAAVWPIGFGIALGRVLGTPAPIEIELTCEEARAA